jgi:hypothetical protein
MPSAVNKHPVGQDDAVVAACQVHPFVALQDEWPTAPHEAVAAPSQLAGTPSTASTAAVKVHPCTLFAFASATATVAQVVASGVEETVQTPPAAVHRTGFTLVV